MVRMAPGQARPTQGIHKNRVIQTPKAVRRLIATALSFALMRTPAGRGRRLDTRRLRAAGALCLLAVLVAALPASAQTLQWTRQFGTPGFDLARALGADATGVYVFGDVGGALPGQSFAGGPGDVYLRKYDFTGNELWTREFGTEGGDFSMLGPVGIDGSALYVGGETNGALVPGVLNAGDYDFFVRRYDTNGTVIWTDQFGGSDYEQIDGIATYRGKVFVAGFTLSALSGQASGGSWDGLVRAYDSDGNPLWTRQFGGNSSSEDFHGVAADSTGVYAVGSVGPGPDFNGSVDVLVVKYDFAGNLVWVRQFGTQGGKDDHADGVATRRGQIYVVGYTEGALPGQVSAGGADVFVRKYDANGNVVWTRQFGTPGNDSASRRRVTTTGQGVYVAGTVAADQALPSQTSAGGRDAFVRQYSDNGDELWTLQFGTSGDDRAFPVAVGENDDVYVGGGITFAAFPGFTNAGGTDAYLTKIAKGS
jgi:hypothetical protein